MKKRILAALLSALFLTGAMGVAAEEAAYPKAEGERFTIFVKQQTIQPDYEQIYMFEQYEKMTGIDIEWINTPQDVVNEKVSLTLAGGDLPDAFLKCGISGSDLQTYGDAGDFLDLSPYLETYAPNFWAYAQTNPDVLASITTPDGAIYSLPAIADAPSTRISLKWFYNQEWLSNLGLEQPADIDAFYAMLKAFKEQDANGNGDPSDEVPLMTSMDNLYQTLGGMFGVLNRGGYHQSYWDADPATGELRYTRTSDAWRELMAFMNKLYEEGLIAQESITYKVADVVGLAAQDRLGMYVMTNLARLSADVADKFAPIETVVKGPHGDQLWPATRSHLHSVGAFVITTACKNPELLLQWVDYFYSEPGILLYHYGVEGETCVKKADGSYAYTDDVLAEMAQGKSYDESIADVTCFGGGNNPTIMSWPGFAGMELTEKPMAASEVLKEHLPGTIWPIFTYTYDENEVVTTVGSDIDNYVKGMCAKFVTGETELNDQTWSDYVNTVEKMGMSEYYEATKAAAQRADAAVKR